MSCHVIVRNRLSLSMGSRGVAAGANPSFVSGRGQGTTWTSCQLITGPSLMSNVGFSILLKDTLTCSSALPGAGIWTTFRSLVDLLYPLSYSRPVFACLFLFCSIVKTLVIVDKHTVMTKHMLLPACFLCFSCSCKICYCWVHVMLTV